MRIIALLALTALSLGHAPAQDFSKIQIEKVDTGFRFTEGPAWSKQGFLLFSDVPNNIIQKFVAGEKSSVYRSNSNGANGNNFDSKGNLYSCESRTKRVVREDKKGKVEVIADKFEGKRLNAPNDIVIRRDGHIYFTDPAFGDQADVRELDFYGVYHITPKGEMSLVAKPEGRPNGIVLSPDGKILYVSNSDERNVRAYDVAKDGATSNERVFASNIDGPPDGMCIDEKGNLYVTANGIVVFAPDGKHLQTIEFSETPRNCAFGDPDMQSLYVTAYTSLYRVRLDVKGSVQY